MNDREHASKLAEIDGLIRSDPPRSTPECDRLLSLAVEVEAFEKSRWPVTPPVYVLCADAFDADGRPVPGLDPDAECSGCSECREAES